MEESALCDRQHPTAEARHVEPIDPERFYSVEAIAERLDLNPATIRLYLRQGDLKGVKVGVRQWRVKGADLISYLEVGSQSHETE